MLTPDIVDELLASARETHAAIGAVPSYMWEGGVLDRLAGASRRLHGVLVEVYEAQRPAELAALLPWIAEHPRRLHARTPFWGRLGHGPAAFVTDGSSLLVVEDAASAPEVDVGYTSSAEAADKIGKLEASIAPKLRFRRLARAAELAPTGERVAIGDAVFNAALIARWFGAPASISGGVITLTCEPGQRGVAHARGNGWRAYVMPIALEPGEATADVPRLPEVRA